MAYIPPQLDQPPYSGLEGPKRKIPRFPNLGDIIMITAAIGSVVFLAALITAIVSSGS